MDEVLDKIRAAVETAAGSVSLRDLAGLSEGNVELGVAGADDRTEPTLLPR